jgi:hypothetical protein
VAKASIEDAVRRRKRKSDREESQGVVPEDSWRGCQYISAVVPQLLAAAESSKGSDQKVRKHILTFCDADCGAHVCERARRSADIKAFKLSAGDASTVCDGLYGM